MLSRPSEWLAGRLVVEMGGRRAVGACGTLLSQAGAAVVFVEPRAAAAAAGKFADTAGKFADRALFAAGKRSLAIDPASAADRALLSDLLAKADIVLTSSDWDFLGAPPPRAFPEGVNVCNFTALGPDSGAHGLTEAEVQALAGVCHTSGFPDGAPVVLRTPVLEYSAAVFGAAACAAALMTARATGTSQQMEVSLFDCAIHLLASFLPSVFQGQDPGRLGNGHPLASPWNAYPCKDGWLLFCTASDVQWQKYCEASGRPDLAANETLKLVAERAKRRAEVDAAVSAWTRSYDTKSCVEQLARVGLASGEIVSLDRLTEEANVRHRRSLVAVAAPPSGETVLVPHSVLNSGTAESSWQPQIPAVDSGRDWLKTAPFEPCRRRRREPCDLPLKGARVIEIGQFTTAPLSARHLAAFGAEIYKIEPLTGDAARHWAPMVDGLSMFFAMSNSGKSCYKVDLRSPEGLRQLEDLVRRADVLVENLKSGSLAGLGLSPARLLELNPRLIYCPITGFGSESAYPGRPAFDTVVQAMSGMMDANAVDHMPLKAGVSACDVMGGQVALFAVIAALYDRQTSGKGAVLDLSMQDIAIWVTARLLNKAARAAENEQMVKCRDGYVMVLSEAMPAAVAVGALCRDEAAAALRAAGFRCAPVRTIPEALASDIGQALRPVIAHRTPSGGTMPLLAPPVVMSPTRLKTCMPPGDPVALDDVAAAV